MKKTDYGFDAPAIMKGLLLAGFIIMAIAVTIPLFIKNTIVTYGCWALLFVGCILFILGVSMVYYGLKGKYKIRELMLSKIDWKGNEMVLDIGAGTGLLMNGAATKLTTGKSIGIDIWRDEDLSNNTMANALENARIEGVTDRVEIKTEDARSLSFVDNTFDVILSQFCIHNIDDKAEQEHACFEIARV